MHQVSLETICALKAFQLHYGPDNNAKSMVKKIFPHKHFKEFRSSGILKLDNKCRPFEVNQSFSSNQNVNILCTFSQGKFDMYYFKSMPHLNKKSLKFGTGPKFLKMKILL